MPKLESLLYTNWDDQERKLDFIGSEEVATGYHTTLITGQNGSNKSTILRDLVSALTIDNKRSALKLLDATSAIIPVICASGTVADRFPTKEMPGGRRTEFDVPNYLYLGQRVGPNLLSKKRPLETLLAASLDKSVRDRFDWKFFESAHKFAGITSGIECVLRPRVLSTKLVNRRTLLDAVERLSDGEALNRSEEFMVSQQMAQFLLSEFTADTYGELEDFFRRQSVKNFKVSINSEHTIDKSILLSDHAVRLGLISNQLKLVDAEVVSRSRSTRFSAFDLSSGEYHMLTTILGIGFGLKENSIVLIDEPENSLHPQWQQDFMYYLFEMCSMIKDGHVVVSTHSPLIVSMAGPGSTIVDLSDNEIISNNVKLFGASADDILFEQFGIASSRNRYVVDTVQKGVALAELGQADGPEFQKLTEDLKRLRPLLRIDDPMIDVIDALLDEGDER